MAAEFSLGNALLGTEMDLSGLRAGMGQARSEAQDGFGGIGDLIAGALKVGVAGAATALAGLGIAGGKAFIDFQASMKEVFTLLPGITQDAMGQMTAQVKDFAAEFGVLPDQVIPALYQSISAGVPPNNLFDFLATAEKAAVGGASDLETAVNGISSVVNAYGADTLSATQASDQMFTAVRLGKTTFAELSQSLFQVIPTAASLGLNFGNVTAALAAMTSQGVPTSVATTQLRQLLVELSKDGSQVAATFEQIAGKSFQEFIAGGGNLQQALQILEAAAQGSGKNISDLFSSVEAGNAALALTGQGTQTFTGNLAAMQNAAGATEAAYATMDDSISRDIDKIRAGFATFLLDIGENLAPAIGAATAFIVANLPAAEAVVMQVFDAIGAAISFVTETIVPPLISAWQTIAPAVDAAGQVLMGVGGIFADLAGQAASWGYGIVSQLAAGLMAAASEVVAALTDIGGIITDLLEPHSPPKLLPQLDQWGADAATIYMRGWSSGDFSAFDQLGGQIESILRGLVDTGQLGQGDLLSSILGSRAGLAQAISEIEQTGQVSAATMAQIRAAAGPAADQVAALVSAFAAAQAASKALADAQAQLDATAKRYDDRIGKLSDRLDANKEATDALDEQERKLRSQPFIPVAELDAIKAKREALERQRKAIERQINQAKREKDQALAAAKAKVEAARKAADAAQEQIKRQQALIRVQQQQNQLIKQQLGLQNKAKGGGGGGGGLSKAEREAKAAAEAQWRYNYAMADTDGKLKMLQDRLATLTPDQAEYWQVSGQIADLEKQKQRELDGVTKAQADYAYQTADTNGKLAILKARLATLSPDQVEYWQTLGQIAQLEGQTSKATGGHARALGGLGRSGITAGRALAGIPKPAQASAGALAGLAGQAEATAQTVVGRVASIAQGVRGAFGSAIGAVSGAFAAVGAVVSAEIGVIVTIVRDHGAQIVADARTTWGAFLATVGGVLSGALAVVSAALGQVATFIQGHNAEIAGFFAATWHDISGIVQTALAIINATIVPGLQALAGVINTHGAEIQAIIGATWQTITAIIDATLALIGGALRVALALIHGDWDGAWAAIQATAQRVGQDMLAIVQAAGAALQAIFGGAVAALIGKAGELRDGIAGVFQSIYDQTIGRVSAMFAAVVGRFLSAHPEIAAQLHAVQADIGQIWEAIKARVTALVDELWSATVGRFASASDEAQSKVDGLRSGVLSILEALKGSVGAIFDGIKADVLGKIGSIIGPARDLGKGIIDGLASAISDGAAKIISALLGLAQKALEKAKESLGINSPSTLVYDELGVPVPEGLALAIEDGAPLIGRALDRMMQPLQSPIANLGLGAPIGALSTAGGALQITVDLRINDRGMGWLERLIDARVEAHGQKVGRSADIRVRTR